VAGFFWAPTFFELALVADSVTMEAFFTDVVWAVLFLALLTGLNFGSGFVAALGTAFPLTFGVVFEAALLSGFAVVFGAGFLLGAAADFSFTPAFGAVFFFAAIFYSPAVSKSRVS